MPTALDQTLTELDALERGFVLGALLVGAGDDPAFTAGLPPGSRERCAHALAAIAALARADRVHVTSVLAREVRAVFPAGIEGVHPDHLRAAVDAESLALIRRLASTWGDDAPASLQAAVAAWIRSQPHHEEAPAPDGEADPELLSDVQRSVFARLAEVPRPWQEAAPRRFSRQLTLMEPAALLALIDGHGDQAVPELGARLAREEAGSLSGSSQLLAVAQRLPAALAQALLEAAGG